jgi:hypothetical protein
VKFVFVITIVWIECVWLVQEHCSHKAAVVMDWLWGNKAVWMHTPWVSELSPESFLIHIVNFPCHESCPERQISRTACSIWRCNHVLSVWVCCSRGNFVVDTGSAQRRVVWHLLQRPWFALSCWSIRRCVWSKFLRTETYLIRYYYYFYYFYYYYYYY